MECGNLHSELYTAPIPDEIDTSNLVRRGSIAFSAVFLIVGLIVLVMISIIMFAERALQQKGRIPGLRFIAGKSRKRITRTWLSVMATTILSLSLKDSTN